MSEEENEFKITVNQEELRDIDRIRINMAWDLVNKEIKRIETPSACRDIVQVVDQLLIELGYLEEEPSANIIEELDRRIKVLERKDLPYDAMVDGNRKV